MLQFVNAVPQVVVIPNHKLIFSFLPPNCNFATVINRNVNMFGARGLSKGSQPTGGRASVLKI